MNNLSPPPLEEGRRLLDSGDPEAAIRVLEPLTRHPDPDIAGEAWLLTGTARYRIDDEAGALSAWRSAGNAGGPTAWLGWRSAAEQEVRDGNLEEAIAAYREADRRAPAGERGAIANRIAWLLKETGHDFAARRQFNRARGAYATYTGYVTIGIIGLCIGLFGADAFLSQGATLQGGFFGGGVGPIGDANLINAFSVAQGEWWRIFTSAFIHLTPIHLAFNMYVLYLYGQIAERMYGRIEFVAIYLLCAAGGSVLTILVDPDQSAAGASGAIFGIVGLLFVVSRRHHAVLGREARTMIAGIGSYLVFLLVFTFIVPNISWTGHLGGLIVGAIIGFLLPPTGVETLGGMWRTPTGDRLMGAMPRSLRAAVYAGVAVVLAAGSYLAVGRFLG
ncbi:MAG TPA: rhomboid family intramembrane serine protease [Candidatus Limnocylindrales bacterium]|nr:rhomboid family intramembrane serine protease [Candidatus Limnocylindrales bacterium]